MEVWENSKKAVETLAYGSCCQSISCSPKLPLVFTLYVLLFTAVYMYIHLADDDA